MKVSSNEPMSRVRVDHGDGLGMREMSTWEHNRKVTYPFEDGDTVVLGPEIFVSTDKKVICWKGTNYVPQEDLHRALDIIQDAMTYDKGLDEEEYIEWVDELLPFMQSYGRCKSWLRSYDS